ncbi:hypothetical protein [Streptosporangium longisporum]|uniref:YbjN domain-containing protein n=1 Tax=Streptosporangium longisporum TaxID=46187 RepID=A0ABN3XV35_9ACTN
MNLDSLIKRGNLPWRPRLEVVDLDVWHEYEIPLTGTFRVNGDLVLFAQVLEGSHGLSAWAYVHLDDSEAREVAGVAFDSLDHLDSFVEARFLGREAVLALAMEDRIDKWTRSRVVGGLLSAVESFINDVIKDTATTAKVPDPKERVLAKIAGLEAARSQLAPA